MLDNSMTEIPHQPHYCRPIIEADWLAILRIQSQVYYDFRPESEAVMRSKADRGQSTCFVTLDNKPSVVAYCLAYPYPADRTAALDTVDPLPISPTDNIFVHDLAVQKASAGRGVAQALFGHLVTVARLEGYRTMSLVAVQQAASFWRKMGFTPSTQAKVNDSYTSTATFMIRDL
tara:strand:+ start:20 stop:544 length:525 start_codon:yes stop_codon:yes gene_type:complete